MILVTGGLGYIGSHTVVELCNKGHEVIIVDDLSNSQLSVLDGIEKLCGHRPIFERVDLKDKVEVMDFFKKYQEITGVIHFAALKAVGQSVDQPLLYYENNLVVLIYLLQELKKMGGTNFIFSSSCTVYGEADKLPITEAATVKPATSPYGNTKQVGEEIIRDTCKVNPKLKAIALRYFNPIGAHSSGEIGELPIGVPQNLVPFITQTAIGLREELSVFGDDYPTEDGTCIRDYVHVVDLAKAHVAALDRLMQGRNDLNYEVFNLGTGKGSSVLEVIQSFERVSGQSLNYKIVDRRPGDVIQAYADTKKANEVLEWQVKYNLGDAIKSAWDWEQRIKKTTTKG
ncbi:UDP-glucose 4-epimerase GalE [Flagellimonas marinaquae]|uniref:UDP-glucose 4-epimerase GalE n=1 Tax=Flagellimonas marinaquae TaxID=254955 RepID=UPI000F8EAEC6|nr:UDP-glucose 4-epimerase GalE [Allomuricauda aquimarina]